MQTVLHYGHNKESYILLYSHIN